ncbi:M48 family metallopeptidase [Haloplanus sp. GCM10025708]|uniref:M48 family metallopeptidase n=1 Tax=Haloferacaceae TaxID=1644056 RepID=UPI003623130D
MRRLVTRSLMAVTGAAMLFVYAVAALAVYRLVLFLWRQRPDPVTTAVVVVGLSLTFGYVSYRLGTARILSALDATELSRTRAAGFYDRIDALTDEMDVDAPRVLVARMQSPNALSLGGPSEGDVVLDDSLFRLLDADELEAIVAHELAHLERRDSLVKTLGYSLSQTVVGLFVLLLLPVTVILTGFARGLTYLRGGDPADLRRITARVQTAVAGVVVLLLFVFTFALQAYSRRREYAADRRAADVTGDPLALARALAKIRRASTPGGLLSMLYIHGEEEGTLTRLLASHPPMEERIERLADRAEERRGQPVRIAVE